MSATPKVECPDCGGRFAPGSVHPCVRGPVRAPDSSPPPVPSRPYPIVCSKHGVRYNDECAECISWDIDNPPAPSPATTPASCARCGKPKSAAVHSRASAPLSSHEYVAPSAPPVPAPLALADLDAWERLARDAVEADRVASAYAKLPDRDFSAGRYQQVCILASVAKQRLAEFARAERVAQLVVAARLVPEFIHDDDPCEYDRLGYCHAHELRERPCPHERAKALLAARAGRPPSEETDAR